MDNPHGMRFGRNQSDVAIRRYHRSPGTYRSPGPRDTSDNSDPAPAAPYLLVLDADRRDRSYDLWLVLAIGLVFFFSQSGIWRAISAQMRIEKAAAEMKTETPAVASEAAKPPDEVAAAVPEPEAEQKEPTFGNGTFGGTLYGGRAGGAPAESESQ